MFVLAELEQTGVRSLITNTCFGLALRASRRKEGAADPACFSTYIQYTSSPCDDYQPSVDDQPMPTPGPVISSLHRQAA